MITCYFESGSKDSLRHVTVASIIVKAGRVLLARRGTFQGRPLLESGKWGLTGGFLDRDETLMEGAIREALEELNIKIDKLVLMHVIDRPDRPAEDRQNVAFTFIAEAVTEPQLLNEEVSEIKWFDLNNLPPRADMAFDFADELDIYRKYLEQKFPLPVIGQTV